MSVAEIEQAFQTYFDEMERCARAKCYWALLHIVVVLPDICAALQSANGDAGNGGPYQGWYKENFSGNYLSPVDRYKIRCALLHQGRTVVPSGSYASYSFIQPATSGSIAHNWVTPSERNMTLDVGEMARDTRAAMRTWFTKLQLPANATKLANVQRHLPLLAREKPKVLVGSHGIIGSVIQTVSSTSSS